MDESVLVQGMSRVEYVRASVGPNVFGLTLTEIDSQQQVEWENTRYHDETFSELAQRLG